MAGGQRVGKTQMPVFKAGDDDVLRPKAPKLDSRRNNEEKHSI
jgi:hypothetical protein